MRKRKNYWKDEKKIPLSLKEGLKEKWAVYAMEKPALERNPFLKDISNLKLIKKIGLNEDPLAKLFLDDVVSAPQNDENEFLYFGYAFWT